jgi:hypothetical protein
MHKNSCDYTFIFQYTPHIFRTVPVYLQKQSFYMLYIVFGICLYHTSGCFVTTATQQPDVSAYSGICRYVWLLCCYSNTTARRIRIYRIRHTTYKNLLLKMDWYNPKHVERILKNKSIITRILCILLVYIHIARLCTVYTISNWCRSTLIVKYTIYRSVQFVGAGRVFKSLQNAWNEQHETLHKYLMINISLLYNKMLFLLGIQCNFFIGENSCKNACLIYDDNVRHTEAFHFLFATTDI